MNRQKPVKLIDIARELKLSTSTVSKALKGDKEISDKTRKAVARMAEHMQYAPNTIAQSLRSSSTHRIGVIVPNLVSHFFSASISGMQDVAAEKGYQLILCQSNESYEKEIQLIQTLIVSRVDGLLISLSKETDSYSHLESLYARGIPLVLFDRTCEEIKSSKVTVDDQAGAYTATMHLLERGYRSIAHVSGPPQLSISKKRLAGYKEALRDWGLAVEDGLIFHCNFLKEEVAALTHQIVDSDKQVDAVFAINDAVAMEVMLGLKKRGVKIPEEIALVGFTNTPDAALLEPALTTISQPSYQLGKIAAMHLLEQIQQPDSFMPQSIMLNTNLVVRSSSRKKLAL